MNPTDILLEAGAQAHDLAMQLSTLFSNVVNCEDKAEIKKQIQKNIKRLDALITLIETDC